jgi:hypothetical protein
MPSITKIHSESAQNNDSPDDENKKRKHKNDIK